MAPERHARSSSHQSNRRSRSKRRGLVGKRVEEVGATLGRKKVIISERVDQRERSRA